MATVDGTICRTLFVKKMHLDIYLLASSHIIRKQDEKERGKAFYRRSLETF